ncbi:DUF2913 family protein [Vibrio tubiashii]|uniref:DUF2913 family protein n=1 Tax=Vibrio tubiashii TaxID=29498 RepID=UPI001EFDFFCA|nr:DUF2913 family protein [Vibrio tubiashii]MCG9575396.1 DUF2913 family protein [Vibrio tubiashii]
MQIQKDFDYYHNLHRTVTDALLHLLFQVSASPRFVPTAKRNEILVKYLKTKAKDKHLVNIKKDIKLMLNIARNRNGNLEMRLYQLNEKANNTQVAGAERLYSLLTYLYDEHGIESRLFEEGSEPEPEILYMLGDHIEHCFDSDNQQIAPLSMLIQSESAPQLEAIIKQQGWFSAEMKEWNEATYQAHLVLHPNS